ILTDIRMPGISGTELCQKLRKYVPEDVKIFALTAQVLPDEQQLILNSGFDGILVKPFREQELLAILGVEFIDHEDVDFQLDYASIEKMTFGDSTQLEILVNQFKKECETDILEIHQALEQKDAGKISLVIHRLAGRIGQFGGKKLAERLRRLEYDLNQVSTISPDYEKEVVRLMQLVRKLTV
ncbi:hybrid sensor histidine kinase/response regulator, partial [Pseudoxanthomonas sp. SGD-10]